MRMSPLLHPLAVLRTTAGLTQKQMGDLVNRAARTIQSIELRKMPLTDELALRIAEVTGVDEAWLAEGNPQTPPRKGLTLLQAGRGPGEYTRADYEYYRAYLETPLLTREAVEAALAKAETSGGGAGEVSDLAVQKKVVLKRQREIVELIDRDLTTQLGFILAQTEASDNMRLVRWKIRRFLEEIAREFALEIGETGISIQALALANPKPPPAATRLGELPGRVIEGLAEHSESKPTPP